MKPNTLFRIYWEFAAERQRMLLRRQAGQKRPWTTDPILSAYRFTNTYRVHDRVTQYLISEVQYDSERSQSPRELFFRTLLFKLFNKIDTWTLLERELGPIESKGFDYERAACVLDQALDAGARVYSAAYIMPSPALGYRRKHRNHLALLKAMVDDGAPEAVHQRPSLSDIYGILRRYRGIGKFLAFQYTIDLNYASFLEHSEEGFVVAGPGAIDGIYKCFDDADSHEPEQIILEVCRNQMDWISLYGIDFPFVTRRLLQPIDCQNLFCEISKYTRVSHPEVSGVNGRTRIKQSFRPTDTPLPIMMYPPRWGAALPTSWTEPDRSSTHYVEHVSARSTPHETAILI